MKKVLIFLTLSVVLLMCLVACGETEHVHEFGEWSPTKNHTCTEDGEMIRYCSCGETQTKIIPFTGHTEVVDNAVESTCTNTGLTNGKHCSVCNEIILAQQETPLKAHTYDDEYDAECNTCGHKRDVDCPHAQTEVIDGKSATCNEVGLTDGTKCKKCGEILVAQTIIPALNHTESDWIVDRDATKTENGKHHTECISCGKTLKEEIIYATGSVGLSYTLKSDGESYFVANMGTCTDTDIVIPAIYNGLPVTSIGGNAFYDKSSIKSIVIPESITSIAAYAFSRCTSLENITIPNSVTNIGNYAFVDCDAITSMMIPDSVTDIGAYAFSDCSKLKSITIPGSIVNISDYAFRNCESLTDVTICHGITSIGDYAFYDCNALKTIIIPNSVKIIGEYAFSCCGNLKSITFTNSITTIGEKAFYKSANLVNVYFTGTVEDWVSISFNDSSANPLYHATKLFFNGELVTEITIPEGVTSIEDYAFYHCESLVSITIPNSVTTISGYAFCYCDSLINVTIGNGVTSIGWYAFESCDSLKSIIIPNSVTTISDYAFCYCDSLINVTIGNGVTSIGWHAFESCDSLKSIIIPNSVTNMGVCVFRYCDSLTIYCETEEKPSGWKFSDWNGNRPVVWGYKGE